MNIRQIFAPLGLERFLAEYWGNTYCHVSGVKGRFAGLFPWSELNRVLAEHRLPHPRLRLMRDGLPVPDNRFTSYEQSRSVAIPRIHPDALARELDRGATLIMDGVHELSPHLRALAATLEQTFHELTRINAYAGWRTSRGFDLHWDDHDVVILQLSGRKRWQLFGETVPAPMYAMTRRSKPPTEPVWDGFLEDGDLLYIPRGHWHVAFPANEPTLHVTCSITKRTGITLLQWVADQMMDHEIFRKDIPRFSDRQTRNAYLAKLKAALLEVWDDSLLERYLLEMDTKALPAPVFDLPRCAYHEQPLEPGDRVRMSCPRPAAIQLAAADTGYILRANGKTWNFSATEAALVRALLPGAPRTLTELHQANEGGLSFEQVEALVRKLWVDGFVVRDATLDARLP